MDLLQVDRFRVAVTRLSRRLRNEGSGESPLSATGLAVLGRLRREGPQTQQSLASGEHVSAPSMTRIVGRLCDLGFATREPHPDDGRAVLVTLSDAGETFVTETVRQRTAWLSERITQLDPEEAEAVRRALPALQRLADLP